MKRSLFKSITLMMILVVQTSVFAVDEAKWDAFIQSAANATGLDFDYIKSIVKAESSFRDKVGDGSVVSTNAAGETIGAVGAMQIMPATGAELGYSVAQLGDPETNIMAGAEYLLQLSQMPNINGDLALMAAAYNAGPGAVQQYGGVPPYTETVNYVQQVAQNYSGYSGVTIDTSGLPTVTTTIPGGPTGPSSAPLFNATTFADISEALASFESQSNINVANMQKIFKGFLVFLMMLLAGVQILFYWKDATSQHEEEIFISNFYFSIRALLLTSVLFILITKF